MSIPSKALGVLLLKFKKLPMVRVKFSRKAKLKLIKPRKCQYARIEIWFDCGGTRSSTRVLRVRYSSLDYARLLLRKSSSVLVDIVHFVYWKVWKKVVSGKCNAYTNIICANLA